MRILLVTPRIPAAAMNFAHAMDIVGCDFSHIPLPLATLAALTPAGDDVAILDENVETIDPRQPADLVAFTGIYCQRERLFELADAFRANGAAVVIGGPIASDVRDECLEHADAVAIGEAEYTWPRLVEDFRRKQPERIYEQIEWVDMADSPIPRYDLLKVDRYSAGCVQATRGCPYQCEYCDVPTKHGRKPRSKPIERVLDEVRILARLGFDSIFFVDDHFVGNRRYARDLLRALAGMLHELPCPVYFYTQVTLNVAKDEEMLVLFHEAGFRRFFLGIETPNGKALAGVAKHQNTELAIADAIERIQRHGITVWAGIMVGLDQDDATTFDEQLAFIEASSITPTLISIMQAMPGAPLYERAKREGRLRVLEDVVASSSYGSAAMMAETNLVPKNLTTSQVLRGYARLVRGVYDPAAYGRRLLRATARAPRTAPDLRALLDRRNLLAVARATRFYVTHPDPKARRLFVDVLRAIVTRRLAGADELLYHLVIWKHLHEFYGAAAHAADAAADAAASAIDTQSAPVAA